MGGPCGMGKGVVEEVKPQYLRIILSYVHCAKCAHCAKGGCGCGGADTGIHRVAHPRVPKSFFICLSNDVCKRHCLDQQHSRVASHAG